MNTKILIISLLSTFILSACSENNTLKPGSCAPDCVDIEVKAYVDEFMDIYDNGREITFKVVIDDEGMGSGVVGRCNLRVSNKRIVGKEVQLRSDQFLPNAMSPTPSQVIKRRAIIFHELGHCFLERKHDCASADFENEECEYDEERGDFKETLNRATTANMPLSIMYPTINPVEYWYNENRATNSYVLNNTEFDSMVSYYQGEIDDPQKVGDIYESPGLNFTEDDILLSFGMSKKGEDYSCTNH